MEWNKWDDDGILHTKTCSTYWNMAGLKFIDREDRAEDELREEVSSLGNKERPPHWSGPSCPSNCEVKYYFG